MLELVTATQPYLDKLLQYYEEEISGEAYFYALAEHLGEHDKTVLLARVERIAANSVIPLLLKYGLRPREAAVLKQIGEDHAKLHSSWNWTQFMQHVVVRYTGYVDDFLELEAIAPVEDLSHLKILTQHEIVAIEFAQKELANDAESTQPLINYLNAHHDEAADEMEQFLPRI